jgi:hypothetical protein
LTKGRIVANRTIRTPEKEERILCALRERPVFSYACKKARIAKSAFYAWRHDDALFDQAVEDARQEGLDALEDALMDRGLETSDTAAIFMLKSHRRAIYGDRATVNVNVTIREKAERMAAELGVPIDDLMSEAMAVAGEAWESWSPPQ